MSVEDHEPSFAQPVRETPAFHPGEVAQVKPRDLLYRFLAGAITSAVAGAVTLAFGAKAGGLFLAFPAILAASLTLIEEQEDSAEAREDARGAVLGGVAMAAFAVVAAVAFGHLAPPLVLVLAAIAWVLVAVLAYAALWWRR